MIELYLRLALGSWLAFILVPWAAVAVAVSAFSPRAFGLYFLISLVAVTVGAVLLMNYAADPAVDGDGTTLFGAATLIGTFAVWGFLTFLVCCAIAAVSAGRRQRRAGNSELN